MRLSKTALIALKAALTSRGLSLTSMSTIGGITRSEENPKVGTLALLDQTFEVEAILPKLELTDLAFDIDLVKGSIKLNAPVEVQAKPRARQTPNMTEEQGVNTKFY